MSIFSGGYFMLFGVNKGRFLKAMIIGLGLEEEREVVGKREGFFR